MIIAAIFLALLIVGAVYLTHKIAYQVGYEAGDAARDCKATKECEECVIRGIYLNDEQKRREKIAVGKAGE
jgi:hypothetical protein